MTVRLEQVGQTAMKLLQNNTSWKSSTQNNSKGVKVIS